MDWSAHPDRRGHGLSVEQQQRALFVTDHGTGFGALDVLDDGLRGSRSRAPALRWILDHSPLPFHRVVAAMILTGWGDEGALATVTAWVESSAGTPPDVQTDSQDVLSRCDNGFELLCTGVGTHVEDEPPQIRAARIAALRGLIALSPHHFVGRAIRRAYDDLEVRWADVADVVEVASHEALDLLSRRVDDECDLALQSAVLVGLLALHHDASGACATRVLLALHPGARAERELLLALGEAGGRDTSALLHELAVGDGSLAKLARAALQVCAHPYRSRPQPGPSAADGETGRAAQGRMGVGTSPCPSI